MRLWTIHPRYLDAKGLVALWREALLAQKVLAGRTRGYTRHPQLTRFRAHENPLAAIATYLSHVADEAESRGYCFNRSRILEFGDPAVRLVETRGQLLHEWSHLQAKLQVRAAELCRRFQAVACPKPHPLFRIVRGGIRDWERITAQSIGYKTRRLTKRSPAAARRRHRTSTLYVNDV